MVCKILSAKGLEVKILTIKNLRRFRLRLRVLPPPRQSSALSVREARLVVTSWSVEIFGEMVTNGMPPRVWWFSVAGGGLRMRGWCANKRIAEDTHQSVVNADNNFKLDQRPRFYRLRPKRKGSRLRGGARFETTPREIPRPAGENAGLRDGATLVLRLRGSTP